MRSKLHRLLLWILPLALLFACSNRRIIVNDLDEREANEIIVFLSTKGIDSFKEKKAEGGGAAQGPVMYNISVDSNVATKAMALLNINGLPRRQGQNLLDIFSGGGLVSSEQEQKIRYQSGLDQQISNTIRKFDGVLEADVLISYPEEEEIGGGTQQGPPKKVTASVYIKHQGVLDDPNSHLIPKIKRLVASSVTGLEFDNVTIIADKSRFADFTLEVLSETKEDEMVKIWTITIAKVSTTRFRIIFFSLITLLFLSLILAGFLLFKLSNLITSKEGIKLLSNVKPLEFPKLGNEEKDEKEKDEKEEEEDEEEEEEKEE